MAPPHIVVHRFEEFFCLGLFLFVLFRTRKVADEGRDL
jgi:hypothetical protein